MSEEEILQIFQRCGALLEGHFELSSGLHSNKYLQCALVLQYPKYAFLLAEALAQRFSQQKIDVVIGPALGGIIIAYEVAKFLNARALFAEREQGKMALRRGFEINEGEKVLIIEDVITTGGSVKELIDLLRERKGEVAGLGAIVDRRPQPSDKQSFQYEYLLKLRIKTFSPSDCPLCKQNIPLVKPGSKGKERGLP
ncbi:MAG: orotate phosphoribosyltransferase [Candidatus Omnitrophica bacterium]|nr:orotate phosphoribosyltransferase [Candidatus Omnitrophota bacterium]